MWRLPKVFNKEQLKALFEHIREPDLAIACLLSLFCGLRISEVANLRVNDIDFFKRQLSVVNSKNPKRTMEGYGKDRIVPMPSFLLSPVKKWIEYIGDNEFLFPSIVLKNMPLTNKQIFKKYKKTLERAGLNIMNKIDSSGKKRNHFNYHTLRHTYATLLWEKTGDIVMVKNALGHNFLETTMIYTHVSNEVLHNKIEDAFRPKQQLIQVIQKQPQQELLRQLIIGLQTN